MSQNKICQITFKAHSKICIFTCLALAACAGETVITPISGDAFEINYTESAGMSSPALVQNFMNDAAMERCPIGYDKLTDRTIKTQYMPTHIWTIRCVDFKAGN